MTCTTALPTTRKMNNAINQTPNLGLSSLVCRGRRRARAQVREGLLETQFTGYAAAPPQNQYRC
jgi:hypothetical protein